MMLFCFVSLMPANILAFNSCDCNDFIRSSTCLICMVTLWPSLSSWSWWYYVDSIIIATALLLLLVLLLLHYCYYWCYCYCTTATTGVINVIKLHCNVFHCFIICEETGVMLENVSIHLMKTWGMTLAVVTLRRTMGTNVSLGMTVMQTTVLLAFRRALTIIMVYL